ncbi:GNAT family N-acetyltransferase [Halobacillus yeomjeoni]|uniref:GNAT family N-acetyltransferase n=1 Tax=Halobacillus yeomjeoni TaxID=311194 RepID=UPI001CD4D171|nr:GNAT family N-acetyltransferase [Halobacillus yeomjeoni]MCA0985031.1 GNAT family N-acetyltransferase [Halobacillus yeomjeoni]
MEIRRFSEKDIEEVLRMIQETIHSINGQDYSFREREVWAGSFTDVQQWTKRIQSSEAFVAKSGGRIVGIVNLQPPDMVDLLYVHKDLQRQGIARSLLNVVEQFASKNKALVLHTESSVTAYPFFKSQGFRIIGEQSKSVQGITMKNIRMCKKLHS